MTSMWHLSDNLLEEIMSFLPVDSLIRMKGVSKSWYQLVSSIINSKPFVAKHLKNSNGRSHPPLLLRSTVMFKGRRVRPKEEDLLLKLVCKDDHLETVFECLDSSSHFKRNGLVVGWGSSSNGIICTPLRHRKANVALYNPALREFGIISGSCLGEDGRIISHQRLGFGHDPISDVYKVIRLVALGDSMSNWEAEIHRVGVDPDNFWRKIELMDPMASRVSLAGLDYVDLYCNGFYYWSVYSFSDRDMLLSFDMHEEKFQTISLPFPSDGYGYREFLTKLVLWNNRSQVAVFRYASCHDIASRPIEMWVMHEAKGHDNDNDTSGSYFWTKHLTMELEQFYHPILFWNNNEELLVRSFNGEQYLASYNLRTRKVRKLEGITNQMKLMGRFRVFTYVHSLVSFRQNF